LDSQPPGVRFSHPDISTERWTRQFGVADTEQLCRWNNNPPDVVLRVNTAYRDVELFLHELKGAGIEVVPHAFKPDQFVILPRGVRITDLPGYSEGWFYVQDPSTDIAAAMLSPKPGERVLDACAAPGGKTVALAQQMEGRGTLMAMDSAVTRMKRLHANLSRMKLDFVTVVEGDAAQPEKVREKCAAAGINTSFQAILLDVPCTNTGVIRRRPDARWRFSVDRLHQVCESQQAILDGAATLLENGGRMVYSTCSLEPEENEEQINKWLARHTEFTRVQERRLFPPVAGADGAYAVLLIRKA
jgi:16S rRNA (cytosine967-C5)-methyltransferase